MGQSFVEDEKCECYGERQEQQTDIIGFRLGSELDAGEMRTVYGKADSTLPRPHLVVAYSS